MRVVEGQEKKNKKGLKFATFPSADKQGVPIAKSYIFERNGSKCLNFIQQNVTEISKMQCPGKVADATGSVVLIKRKHSGQGVQSACEHVPRSLSNLSPWCEALRPN